jgi:hypothetical protein
MTALMIQAEEDATITIQEFDGSNYFMKDYKLKKEDFFQFNPGPPGDFTSRKFYSGIKIRSDKSNTHFQMRCFVRV